MRLFLQERQLLSSGPKQVAQVESHSRQYELLLSKEYQFRKEVQIFGILQVLQGGGQSGTQLPLAK